MKMLRQKSNGAYELEVGNNIVEINVISEDNRTNKIYKINVYRKSEIETQVYNKMKEESEEKIQEIFNSQTLDELYNIEKTSLTVSYVEDNEIIKIMILMIIFCAIVMSIVINKMINIKYRQK